MFKKILLTYVRSIPFFVFCFWAKWLRNEKDSCHVCLFVFLNPILPDLFWVKWKIFKKKWNELETIYILVLLTSSWPGIKPPNNEFNSTISFKEYLFGFLFNRQTEKNALDQKEVCLKLRKNGEKQDSMSSLKVKSK